MESVGIFKGFSRRTKTLKGAKLKTKIKYNMNLNKGCLHKTVVQLLKRSRLDLIVNIYQMLSYWIDFNNSRTVLLSYQHGLYTHSNDLVLMTESSYYLALYYFREGRKVF